MEPVAPEIWDRVANSCAYATFFHSRAWTELIVRTFPHWENATAGWRLSPDRTAVLPLLRAPRLRGMFHAYQSVVPGVYGGVICDGPLGPGELRDMYLGLRTLRSAGGVIVGNPFGGHDLPEELAHVRRVTHAIDLTAGLEAVWARMESSFRRRVRRAREKGVEVRPAQSLSECEEYHQLYDDALLRWGDRATSHYPKELFLNLWDLASRSPESVKIWLARVEGRVAAGAIVLYHRGHAVSWHAATRREDYAYSPANALQMTIIEDAGARGFRWYDLNPSGGHAGVARFKEGLGATGLAFDNGFLPAGLLWRMCQSSRRLLERGA